MSTCCPGLSSLACLHWPADVYRQTTWPNDDEARSDFTSKIYCSPERTLYLRCHGCPMDEYLVGNSSQFYFITVTFLFQSVARPMADDMLQYSTFPCTFTCHCTCKIQDPMRSTIAGTRECLNPHTPSHTRTNLLLAPHTTTLLTGRADSHFVLISSFLEAAPRCNLVLATFPQHLFLYLSTVDQATLLQPLAFSALVLFFFSLSHALLSSPVVLIRHSTTIHSQLIIFFLYKR